jgi:hypothetical protein
MKKHLLETLALVLTLLSGPAYCHEPDTLSCLLVHGSFDNAFDKNREPCTVEVIRDGAVVDTLTLTPRHRSFIYTCEKEHSYVFRVRKPGYAVMQVEVNTCNVEREDQLYQFKFRARLISEQRARTFNEEALLRPYALIRYDTAKKNFAHDEEYHIRNKFHLVFHAGQQKSMESFALK